MGVSAVALSGCSRATPAPYKPVADVKRLMNDVIEPTAEIVWGASGVIITAEGEESRVPTTEAEWVTVRRSALVLAEAGNLLMVPARAQDDSLWMRMARAMVDKGEATLRAAEQKNGQQLFDAGGELYGTCLNCHQQYLKAMRDARRSGQN